MQKKHLDYENVSSGVSWRVLRLHFGSPCQACTKNARYSDRLGQFLGVVKCVKRWTDLSEFTLYLDVEK